MSQISMPQRMGFFKNIRQRADLVLQQENVACAELRKHAVGVCFIHSPVGAAEKQNGVLCLSADLNARCARPAYRAFR